MDVHTILDSKSFILLLLCLPFLINLAFLIKQYSKITYYVASITLCLVGMSLNSIYGPIQSSICISRWVVFTLDTPSWLYVELVYVCWAITILYSAGYIRSQFSDKAETFHRYLSATMGLSIGAGLAGNFFTLIFFYTASIPTIIPLIQIRGDDISRAAARYYFRATFLPAIGIIIPTVVILFPADVPFQDLHIRAMGWSHTKASLALALLVVGFSKNCVAPFHLWLPNSAVAPAPITALIHSVAAVQTASIALFKVAKHTYGEELLQDLSDHIFETGWLIYLCGGTAVYTAYRAWKTPDLKQRFSFSTVGQLSYIITAIVVGSHQCMQGALLHIMTHSFAKLNLFFCAGAYVTAFGTVQGPEVARFIPHRRWLGVAAMISGLSIGGFPFLAGYYSKDIMLLEELHRHHYSAALFLLAGSILNFIYIFPIIRATFSRKQSLKQPIASLSITMTAAIVLCTGIILALSHYVYYVMRYLEY